MSMLNIGTSALTTAQNSLTTTSHNISNVNTEGYSRQTTDQATRVANPYGDQYIGTGVQTTNIERAYDNFLANQVRSYTALEAQHATYLNYAKGTDELLGSTTLGLDDGLDTFFNAVAEVANDPTSTAARQLLLTEADVFSDKLNTLNQQIEEFDDQLDNTLRASIEEINSLSKGIAELNLAITTITSAGSGSPNDLLDKRDQLFNELSSLVSISTLEEDSGAISVFIGNGQSLVVGNTSMALSAINDTSTTPARLTVGYGPSQIDISAQISGGELGGIFQVRSEILDTTLSELDDIASALVTSFNTVQTAGVDLNGNAGTNLFDPTGVTARTINVVMTDPDLIAASSTTNPGVGNNENALAMADLQAAATMASGTKTFSEGYGSLVAKVATKTMQAEVGQRTQAGLLSQVQQSFDSVSGVNLDEEAADLIKFQQYYQAASQIITVSNTVFNSLINAI
jgi:flagellar hook-associated protein 1 FlgK